MTTREEIMAEVRKLAEDCKPQPNDIYTADLVAEGMGESMARRFLDDLVKKGELRKVKIVFDGKERNAYRPVE